MEACLRLLASPYCIGAASSFSSVAGASWLFDEQEFSCIISDRDKCHYMARAHKVSKKPREEGVELICGIATTAIPADSRMAVVPNRSSGVVSV